MYTQRVHSALTTTSDACTVLSVLSDIKVCCCYSNTKSQTAESQTTVYRPCHSQVVCIQMACHLPLQSSTLQRLSSTLATYKQESFLSYYFNIFDNTWLCHSIMQNSECINIYNSTTWLQAETYKVLHGHGRYQYLWKLLTIPVTIYFDKSIANTNTNTTVTILLTVFTFSNVHFLSGHLLLS